MWKAASPGVLVKHRTPSAAALLLRKTLLQLNGAVIVAGLPESGTRPFFGRAQKASPAPDSGESGHNERPFSSSRVPVGHD